MYLRLLSLLLCSTLLVSRAMAAPMLITRTTDGVKVDDGSQKVAVPKTTFALLDGQTLYIPEGGIVTVVSAGKAEQILGPKQLTTAETIGSQDAVKDQSSLNGLMSKQTSMHNVGATRGGASFSLLLPVPDSQITALSQIRWDCTDCQGTIALIRMVDFQELWSKELPSSSRLLDYTGDSLAPGEYAIRRGEQYIGFTVISPSEAALVKQAIAEAKKLGAGLSTVDLVMIEAGLWWQAGLPAEALGVCEEALQNNPQQKEISELRRAYLDALGQ